VVAVSLEASVAVQPEAEAPVEVGDRKIGPQNGW